MHVCECTQTQMRECVYKMAGCLSADVNAWIRVESKYAAVELDECLLLYPGN